MTASTRLPLPKECSRRFGRLGEVVRSTLHKQKWSYGRLVTGSMRLRALSHELSFGAPTSSSRYSRATHRAVLRFRNEASNVDLMIIAHRPGADYRIARDRMAVSEVQRPYSCQRGMDILDLKPILRYQLPSSAFKLIFRHRTTPSPMPSNYYRRHVKHAAGPRLS